MPVAGAKAAAAPHGLVEVFDRARISGDIEKRRGHLFASELGFQFGEPFRLVRQHRRDGDIVFFIRGDQFGKPDSVQKTACDARRKSVARAGHDGHTRPKRVARCRMRAIGRRIQHEIGELQAAEMRALAHVRREDQAIRRDPPRESLGAQIAFRVLGMQQPEHAARCFFQQAAPEIEDRRRDFIGLIETAENEAGLRLGLRPISAVRPCG